MKYKQIVIKQNVYAPGFPRRGSDTVLTDVNATPELGTLDIEINGNIVGVPWGDIRHTLRQKEEHDDIPDGDADEKNEDEEEIK